MTNPKDLDEPKKEALEGYQKLLQFSDNVPKELRQDLGIIRQLINEEFVAKDKQISSDQVYSLVERLLAQYRSIQSIKEAIPKKVSVEDDPFGEKQELLSYINYREQGYNQAIDDFLTALGIEEGE